MNEPITWADWIMADLLLSLLGFVGAVVLLGLIVLAGTWEQWKSRQPDWDSDVDYNWGNIPPKPRTRKVEVVEFIDYDGSYTGKPGGKVRMPGRMVEDDPDD